MSVQDKREKLKALGTIIAMSIEEGDYLNPEYINALEKAYRTRKNGSSSAFEESLKTQHFFGNKRINPALRAEIMQAIDTIMAEEIDAIHQIAERDLEIVRLRAEVAILRGHQRIQEILDEKMRLMEQRIREIFEQAANPAEAGKAALEAQQYVSEINFSIRREMQCAIDNEIRDMEQCRYPKVDPVSALAAKIRFC